MNDGLCSRTILSYLTLAAVAASASYSEEKEEIVIQEGSSVSVEYTLKLDDGTTVDSNVGQDPLTYKQGEGEILPALEVALLGQAVGDSKSVKLTADEGYGAVNPEAYEEVPIDSVPEEARQAGAMLVATSPEGQQQPIRVHEVKESTVVLDFNHPLAGEALNFDVKILAID